MSPRLRDGVVLYEGTDGSWRCYDTGDRFLRVHAAAEPLRLLQHVLHGAMPLEQAVAATDDPDALHAVLEAFGAQGLLADTTDAGGDPVAQPAGDAGAREHHRCARARVHVEGDSPIADLVAGQLTGHAAAVTRGPVGDGALDGVDALVSCGGWLTDEHWRRVDDRCARAGIPWQMCHAEGTALVVGPCALPGRGPRYADTRARRLAAAAFPDELLAHWRALEAGAPLPQVPWPDHGTQLAVAALLIADTCAALAGRTAPGEAVQTVVDGRSGATTRHTVRPLPDLQATTS